LLRPIDAIGKLILDFLSSVYAFVGYIGDLILLFIDSLKFIFRGQIHVKNTIHQISHLGADSIVIVFLCIGFTGITLSYILTDGAVSYGLPPMIVPQGVSLAMAQELAPVLAALVLAGRVGSGITSELGSMKVTEQIDALRAIAVSPVKYLVVPRLLACMISIPMITFLACVVGIMLGYLPAHLNPKMEMTSTAYFSQVKEALEKPKYIQLLFQKSVIFAAIIVFVGCREGFNTRGGAQGVGISVTRSVVFAMILIFLANLLITLIKF
jgi:phospholipid/cholesterol/gamma-HCH transport system permease protein